MQTEIKKMIRFFVFVVLVSIISVISGCYSLGENSLPRYVRTGSAQFSREPPSSLGYCSVYGTFTNKSGQVVEPYVKIVAFDSSNNTIDSKTIGFSPILSGKIQKRLAIISKEACAISKIVITEAYDAQTRYLIGGVDKTTHSFR